jgi:integrase
MADIKFKYLVVDRDRHGNLRRYVRKKGQPKIRIRGEPGTETFAAAYQAALGGNEILPSGGKSKKPIAPIENTFLWLCQKYYHSPLFKELMPRSQRVRQLILDKFCVENGQKPFRLMQPHHVEEFRDDLAEKPGAATNLIKALRHVFKYAKKRQLINTNPAREVEYLRKGGSGFHTWTLEEVRQFEQRWPIGTQARAAMALLLFTGQRRSDVVKLGRQHERHGVLQYRQTKAENQRKKHEVPLMSTPILPELRQALDACPSKGMTFLETHHGKPYTANGFGNAFRRWCDKAELFHCSAHGLRKAGACIAAENGATEAQLMAIFGWESLSQASLYIKAARRKVLTQSAQHLIVPKESVPLPKPTHTSGTNRPKKSR